MSGVFPTMNSACSDISRFIFFAFNFVGVNSSSSEYSVLKSEPYAYLL